MEDERKGKGKKAEGRVGGTRRERKRKAKM